MQPTMQDVDACLETLRSEDPKAAQNADAGLQALTAGEGFDRVSQYELQYFLWYTLPKKFLAPLDAKLDVADALGRLLDMIGLARYATICRSETTRECIEAWEEDGLPAYRRAQKASGVEPQDVEELTWGTYLGWQENAALHGSAAALEMAILAGDLEPGAPGWTRTQKEITRAWLTTSNAAFEGRTPLEAVYAERIQGWLGGRSELRRKLMESVAPRLGKSLALPLEADRSLEPLRWFLDAARDGIALTQKHNLNRAFVNEVAARWDWWDFPTPPTTELEFGHLHKLHHFARRVKLVRRKGRRLLIAPAGRRGLDHTESLWRTVAGGLVAGEAFEQAVTELVFALLAREKEMEIEGVAAQIAPMLAQQGWSTTDVRGSRISIDENEARRGIYDVIRLGVPLGIVTKAKDWHDRSVVLTEFGLATALEALRVRSIGPRRSLFA